MAVRRVARLWEYVALVVALGLTGIVWWTIAPSIWPDADPNLLLAGEVVLQLSVVFGGAFVLKAVRNRRQGSAPPPRSPPA